MEDETQVIHQETQLTAGRIFSSAVINVLIRAGQLPAWPQHEGRAGGLWRRRILRGTTGEGRGVWGRAIRLTSLRPCLVLQLRLEQQADWRGKKCDRIHGISVFVISEQFSPRQVWCSFVHLLDISAYGTRKQRVAKLWNVHSVLVYWWITLVFQY